MRHSRKAVMKEHYELYLKKYIFNGKYLVRNVQIGIGLVLIMVLIIGVFAAGHISKNETLPEKSADISVKDALFGSAEEEKVLEKTAEAENQKNTTEPAKDLSMNTGITLTSAK